MSSVDTSIGQGGTFAQGPASPVQPPGMGITTVPTFLSPSANLSAAFTSGTIVALGSFPPAGPIDGQQAILELPSTYDPVGGKKIRWAFAYNAGDAVWDFIGGPALYAEVQTAESDSSASYGDLATIGPSLTVPRTGDYVIGWGFAGNLNATTQGPLYMGLNTSSGSPADTEAAIYGGNTNFQAAQSAQRVREKAGLTALSSVTAKYRAVDTTHVGTLGQRWLTVTPVRIA